jgi:magnesium and cobalt transporter
MTNDAAPPPAPRAARREDEAADGPSRGLLGRLFGALSGPDEPRSRVPASPPTAAAPALGNLRRLRVEDVAVPKSDIVAVPVEIALPALLEIFRETGRTRLPVYEGSLDQPIGLVNLKDVALRHGFGGDEAPFDLRSMLRPLLYVPPSMPLAPLLSRMQAERIHMALVIDEYGGTDGLCTIEDLVEQVVGEIDDEHDEEEAPQLTQEGDGVWVADGATPLAEIEAATGRDLTAHEDVDAEEVDTIGGLAFLLAGHVPRTGEVVAHPDGPLLEVLEADRSRIKRVRLRLAPPPP